MKLNEIADNAGARKSRMRVGRGTVQVPSPVPPGVRVTVSGNAISTMRIQLFLRILLIKAII